ncbi:MAG: galactokinase [Spartobacteria bacterium]
MPSQDRHVTAYAPGRVELLGNHTDYNEGVVLGAAIDRGLTISGRARDDGLISLRSKSREPIDVAVAELQPQTGEKRWANYPLGVAAELIARGTPIRGFSAKIDSDIPAGIGLSSSAAFEVATAFFLLKLYQRELPLLDIAKICQKAEHTFAGVKSGLLDQVMSIFGKADHVIFFDSRTEEVRTIPFPKDLALIIAESETKRELVSGKYNERREETRAAAQALGVHALRDVSLADLNQHVDLAPVLRRRAAHVIGENERVGRALELLEAGDGIGLGELMNASHESSRTNFENSSIEQDLLVDLAREIPGVLGSRLTGGGFGGATVTLCSRDKAEDIAKTLRAALANRIFICRVAGGAR